MVNINSHINVKFYYLLNETTPGSVAKTVFFKKLPGEAGNVPLVITKVQNSQNLSFILFILLLAERSRLRPVVF